MSGVVDQRPRYVATLDRAKRDALLRAFGVFMATTRQLGLPDNNVVEWLISFSSRYLVQSANYSEAQVHVLVAEALRVREPEAVSRSTD